MPSQLRRHSMVPNLRRVKVQYGVVLGQQVATGLLIMATSHEEALNRMLERVGTISVGELRSAIARLLECDRTEQELADWRFRRGKLKKVCDEIIPVDRLFRYLGISEGTVSFPLDNKVPDCHWSPAGSPTSIGIEVTIAQGRARYILSKELVENGLSRGYLSLSDDAEKEEVEVATSSQRVMYTSKEALSSMLDGIKRCLREKNDAKYVEMILVIEADLTPLRPVNWEEMIPELRELAESMPFSQIFIVGKGERLIGMRIK